MNKSPKPTVIASMKTNLIGLAVAATALTSFAAFADHDDWEPGCDHEASAVNVPAPAPRADGRYELRTTQRWVPERYEEVTVQQCRESHGWNRHFRRQVCYPVTQTRLVPGSYQTVQEWVWVPAWPQQQQQYSQYPAGRPPMFGQGRVGVRFGFR